MQWIGSRPARRIVVIAGLMTGFAIGLVVWQAMSVDVESDAGETQEPAAAVGAAK